MNSKCDVLPAHKDLVPKENKIKVVWLKESLNIFGLELPLYLESYLLEYWKFAIQAKFVVDSEQLIF